MMKICGKCKLEKSKDEFYARDENRTQFHAYCKVCWNKYRTVMWIEKKKKAIDLFGGSCQKCGYSKYFGALEFHHINKEEKEFDWTTMRRLKWEDMLVELNKCALLCANCHREEHAMDAEKYAPINLEINMVYKTKSTGKCKTCHNNVFGTMFCSTACKREFTRKVKNRPTQQTLKELLKTNSLSSVGKMYGVSHAAVKKWVNEYQ